VAKRRTIRMFIIFFSAGLMTACSDPGDTEEKAAHASSNWKVVWSDEFDGDALDTTKWTHEFNCYGGGNNEQQCYTNRPENTQLVDGLLNIIAREESFSGPATWEIYPGYDPDDTSVTKPYTSGRIVSRGKYGVRYGRIEMRARLPKGQGVWPAFWMLSDDDVYGGWPLSGEIDIMEGFNTGVPDSGRVGGATQYGMMWPNYYPMDEHYHPIGKLTEDFHVYAVEWEADEMRWFIDGDHYMTQRSEAWYSYIWGGQDTGFHVPTARAPFDQPFHIILNLAIGGNAVGQADTDWPEDRRFEVDYVRVYQCDSGNADGTGCAGTIDPVNPELTAKPDDGKPTISLFSLYDDEPSTLDLSHNGAPVENALVLVSEGAVEVNETDGGDDRGNVIQARFEDTGTVSLASGSMSATEGLLDAVEFRGRFPWGNLGEIRFDLYINSIAVETELKVGLGGIDGQPVSITVPEPGQWTRVAVRLLDFLQPDSINLLSLDLRTINKLFVLGSTGAADILLDNVSISCAVTSANVEWLPEQSCSMIPAVEILPVKSPAILFDDEIGDWAFQGLNADAKVQVLPSDDTARGNVIAVNFEASSTFGHFGSGGIRDFSAFAGGTLEFDLLIESEPDDAEWFMLVDCFYPCGTGSVPLSASVEGMPPAVGDWQHYTFRVDDLVQREGSSLDLRKVNFPLAVFPSWLNQRGAAYRLDNVVYKAPAD